MREIDKRIERRSEISGEMSRRLQLWEDIKQSPQNGFTFETLDKLSIYRGSSTLHCVTIGDSPDEFPMSIRKIDRDHIFDDGVVFFFGRSSDDEQLTRSQILALLSARRTNLPIFVVFPHPDISNMLTARLGWVSEYDAKLRQFLVLFGDDMPEYDGPSTFSNVLEDEYGARQNIVPKSAPLAFWRRKLERAEEDIVVPAFLGAGSPTFAPTPTEFFKARRLEHYTVICGSNNSGKSLLLKNLKFRAGRGSYMMGAQRFYHLFEIPTQNTDPSLYSNLEKQFVQGFRNENYNYENNFIDLGGIIRNLTDAKRDALFHLCEELLGSKFSLRRINPENELSMRYIDMDGQNLSLGSTGTRLLITMLGICMDENFNTIFIDEPELGLGPRIQSELALFLADKQRRSAHFPHLETVIVATHSHQFLDRRNIQNNFLVKKTAATVEIEEINNYQKFHNLQFNLLGNSLESIFLPTAFVLVEGVTDQDYLEACIRPKFSQRNILISRTNGAAKEKLHQLKESLGDIYRSPYRNRTFVVVDSVHNPGEVAALEKMGLLRENIVVWSKNGIEHFYPEALMTEIFGCSPAQLSSLVIEDDIVSLNKVTRKKSELCTQIVRRMTAQTVIPDEITTKLITPLAAAIE